MRQNIFTLAGVFVIFMAGNMLAHFKDIELAAIPFFLLLVIMCAVGVKLIKP